MLCPGIQITLSPVPFDINTFHHFTDETGSLEKFSGLGLQARGQAPVAHTCNPSYSGGRDQEDRSSKPAQANSL
jgi:hypothetical protein